MGVVIAAVPEKDDLVWKVSSEKVPHLTLLYLGDTVPPEDAVSIVQFVEHAANTVLTRFWLDVDKRGTLGEDQADVVFFEGWDLPDLKRFRSFLLMNETVAKAHLNATQFPEWLPHLTLGYPQSPASELKDDRIYSVRFDKIAVWFGDFNGPEFELKKHNLAIEEVAMGATTSAVDDILAHYGVKGMKWGVRKSPEKAAAKAEKKLAKADKKWEKKVKTPKTFFALHNAAAAHLNKELPGINARFDAKYGKEINDGVLFDPGNPITKEYARAVNDSFKTGLEKAAKDMGTNPSGTRKVRVVTQNRDSIDHFGWAWGTKEVEHAAMDNVDIFVATLDDKGRLISVRPDAMAQADQFVSDYLAHYGVKGMKWGVRKSDVPAGETRVTQKGRKLKGEGGKGLPAHEDAKKAAVSKQKAKGSGIQSLSNQELKDLANRMNLEQQVRQLSLQDKQANANPAARFIKRTLTQSGKQEAQKAANNATSKLVANMMKAK